MHRRAKLISRLATALLVTGLTVASGVSATNSAGQARSDGLWKVERGQWLSRIVAALEPDRAARPALMAELVALNPGAFVNGDANRMRAGAVLRLPQRLRAGSPPPVAAAAATPPDEVVGHVTVARGRLVARGPDGSERQLHRRSPIQVGDTLETGARGGAHIRFADGAQVAVRRGSLFRIDDYRWQGQADGKERAVLSLLRGGFRTITGAIGKLNRDNYQVKTPFSTIGIRGTDYGMRTCQGDCEDVKGNKVEDGDYGSIKGGAIFAKPDQGKGRKFVGGESFFIANASSEPTEIPSDAGIVYGPDTSLDDSGEGEGGAPDDSGDFRSDGSPEGVVAQAGLESTANDQESVFDTGQEETAVLSEGGGVSNERPAPLGAGGIAAYIVESGGQPFGTFVGAIQGEPGEELDIADGSILVTHVANGFGFQEFDRGTAAIVAKGSHDAGTPNGVHWGIWGQGWQANIEGIAEVPFATATLAPFIYAERATTETELAQLGPLGTQTYSLTNGVVVNQNGEIGTINSFSFDADFLSMNVSNGQLNVTDGPRTWSLSGGQALLENGTTLFMSGSCNGCANPSAIGIAQFGFVGNADAAKAIGAFDTQNGNGNHALVGVAELAR